MCVSESVLTSVVVISIPKEGVSFVGFIGSLFASYLFVCHRVPTSPYDTSQFFLFGRLSVWCYL